MRSYLKVSTIRESLGFFVFSIAMLVFSFYQHGQMEVAWKLSPYLFPLLVSVFLLLLSVSLFFEGLKQVEKGETAEVAPLMHVKALVVFLVLSAVYYFVMPLVGFRITNFAYLVALFLLFGERSWPRIVLISLVATLAIYYPFHNLLHVMLP